MTNDIRFTLECVNHLASVSKSKTQSKAILVEDILPSEELLNHDDILEKS